MQRPTCIHSSAMALRRVFLSKSDPDIATIALLRPLLTPALTATTITTNSSYKNSQNFPIQERRCLLHTSNRCLIPRRAIHPHHHDDPSGTGTGRAPKLSARGKLINEDIPYKWVLIPDAETNKLPEDPIRLDRILFELDRKVFALEMVAPPPPRSAQPSSAERRPPAAICRIIDLQAQRAVERERAKAERTKKVGSKELELNWAIASHDLEHRLRKLREFLEKGFKVDILLARKKGGKRASKEEADEVLEKIREVAAEVGARDVKVAEGNVGGTFRLFLEGPQGKKSG